ncbi:hypothetical protein J7T55_012277 [Diaporthe amygdali]|uniref:uncharacterized protein n=1 Tax=Phomopsis amygdali TaxID=1214568 RepID=UPI0022FE83EC|nr:uncharacterized protein J7T55_012277 [Diaporthe amygdali]KAJ0123807.1 hypothetical protein J7T55_012277 [Diaporthe amygdali]
MSLKPWWDYPGQDDPKYANVPPPEKLDTSKADQALDEDHLAAYVRAVTNVLSTELAESTFAQLVDGLPLWDVVDGLHHYGLEEDEPVFRHRELCPGVIEKTRTFCAAFEPRALYIRTGVLRRYQSAPIGSRASKLPLIELIAVAVHTIAAQHFKQVNGGLHRNEKYPSDEYYAQFTWRRRKPTPFSLWRYDDPEQYPDGNADIAAYWAEDQIFGGIVLFDRGESGSEQNGVWFHSSRRRITNHVYALRDEQTASLLLFLESELGKAPCPFPILGDRNSVRRDWEISIPKYNIYRDRWEHSARESSESLSEDSVPELSEELSDSLSSEESLL